MKLKRYIQLILKMGQFNLKGYIKLQGNAVSQF